MERVFDATVEAESADVRVEGDLGFRWGPSAGNHEITELLELVFSPYVSTNSHTRSAASKLGMVNHLRCCTPLPKLRRSLRVPNLLTNGRALLAACSSG